MQEGRTIAYLRVSTSDQDLEKNKADILHFANDKKLGHVEWVHVAQYAGGMSLPYFVLDS